MKKKTLLLIALVAGLIVWGVLISNQQKKLLSGPQSNSPATAEEIKPSNTFIDYTDPAGFSFSYPDNLSISKAETEDPDTYADLQLFSKDISGSLTIKITDSKITSLDDWLKANKIPSSNTPIEKKLGNLKALEVKTTDRLLLGALDQGVLFTIELPLIEQDFWMKVYNRLLPDFTFASPVANNSQGISNSSSEDVIFEAEEVVE